MRLIGGNYFLAMFLNIAVLSIAIAMVTVPVAAADTGALPLDVNGDGTIGSDEMASAILDYLERQHAGTSMDEGLYADLTDGAYVYTYWNKTAKTVHDFSGQTVTLTRPIHRAVVMNGETAETLRSLGFDSTKVVGVGKYILEDPVFFPEYAGMPNVGSIWSPDYEKIISLSPDTVIIYADFMDSKGDEIQETIQSMDPSIHVLRYDLFNPETYAEEVGLLAAAVDREDEGSDFVAFYTQQMNTVTGRVATIPEDERVTVYFENADDYKSCAEGSGYHDKIIMAGGHNIFGNATPSYPEVNPESVLFADPEVVLKLQGTGVLDFGGYADDDTTRTAEVYEGLLARPGWNSMAAVKDGRVYIIDSDIFGGPKHFIGILYLATWFYPDMFADVNPEDVHQEYLTTYQHSDYDLSSHGVFVYPVA
ncbi:ABC transporter substrate-binding protein [Methanogenium organophilum]|uniref:ABC transporter substrate-binding protein n=1 Tax=Methanogenium organophilum TaxID=2199 RepID=A0A9X9S2A8_METOG|nr:ABC transporter substrate-binding protein [Methanogenium organophilum]WAI00261.1 ABC transporter substrate-binding protein [Methanogenium organophilum]